MQIIRVVSICKARTSHIPWYITYEGEQKLLCGGKHIGPALSTFNFERIVFVFDQFIYSQVLQGKIYDYFQNQANSVFWGHFYVDC